MNNRIIRNIGINYGYLIDKVPQEVLDELKPPIDKLKSNFNLGNKWNQYLIGEIEHEYKIDPPPLLKQYIRSISEELDNEIHYVKNNYISKSIELSFSELWVNFQKKYEYNPVHYHAGLFSFVIWYQIPYLFEDELKYSSKPNNEDCNHGQFEFVVSNPYNRNTNIHCIRLKMDKKEEGHIAIFPSSLNHTVYPFYSSDDYRITVAGNIHIKTT